MYQLLTEWSDEFFEDNGYTALEVYQLIEDMLDDAKAGFYAAFVTNVHPTRYVGAGGSDLITGPWSRALWRRAHRKGIPVWNAARFLNFTNARQSTRFDNLTWDGTILQFDIVGPSADQVAVVIPAAGLVSVSMAAEVVMAPTEMIRGRPTAFLTALTDGAHVVAEYA